MRVTVKSTIDDLEADLRTMTVEGRVQMVRAVERNADRGVLLARGFATRSAGRHGKHYPNSITAEPRGELKWEYGPDSARPQGGMSFEYGSRNQPPHLDLAKSADIIGPKLASDVGDLVDKLFWPGA